MRGVVDLEVSWIQMLESLKRAVTASAIQYRLVRAEAVIRAIRVIVTTKVGDADRREEVVSWSIALNLMIDLMQCLHEDAEVVVVAGRGAALATINVGVTAKVGDAVGAVAAVTVDRVSVATQAEDALSVAGHHLTQIIIVVIQGLVSAIGDVRLIGTAGQTIDQAIIIKETRIRSARLPGFANLDTQSL